MTLSVDELETRRAALEAELGERITVDGLSATLRIFQRKKGHRHSTDDLLTAWYALEKSPPAMRALSAAILLHTGDFRQIKIQRRLNLRFLLGR